MNRARILAIPLALVLAAGFIFYLRIPKEPCYQGRKLCEWTSDALAHCPSPYPGAKIAGEWTAASNAVQQIGLESAPFLLKWASTHDSKLRLRIMLWLSEHSSGRISFDPGKQNRNALVGFYLLGKQAQSVQPLLIQWTYDKDPYRRKAGLTYLVFSHADESVVQPMLSRLLQDPSPIVQRAAHQIAQPGLAYVLSDPVLNLAQRDPWITDYQ